MGYLVNNKFKLLCLLVLLSFSFACREAQKKFKSPVKEVIKLDSTVIGISTIASHLKVPWDIEWGWDGNIWFTIQEGLVKKVNPHTGETASVLNVKHKVYTRTTPGLLGMDIYSRSGKNFVFLVYTHKEGNATISLRLERYTVANDSLINPFILRDIPGGKSHNGSRVAVSPEGKVFWATGDLAVHGNSQSLSSPNGKVLRLNMDGSIPDDNPYPDNPVWSLGFRAPEGLTFTPDGVLFLSTNGPATDDEINRIKKSGNYGWPDVSGYVDLSKEKEFNDSVPTTGPLKAWTPTIAPAGIAYYHSDKIAEWNNSLLLVTLKGSSLRVLKLNDAKDSIISEKIFFRNKFGRLRDVCVSPSGDIYISTSNRDWKQAGKGQPDDDRIIRIAKINDAVDNLMQVDIENPTLEKEVVSKPSAPRKDGMSLYQSYCSSCHRMNGEGSGKVFPALSKNSLITGKDVLIKIILNGGKSIPAAYKNKSGQKMPSFKFLDDEQVADILTYIRTSWDNNEGMISASEVKKIRKKLK